MARKPSGPSSKLQQAVAAARKLSSLRPQIAVVLGSGFEGVASVIDVDAQIPYRRLPGFSSSQVSGHAGRLLFGRLGGLPIIMLSGRAHFYEGYSMDQITFPIRVLAALGVRDLLLTNAAGGIKKGMLPGDFMVVTDHINFMGTNPLRGSIAADGPCFVDLTRTYDDDLRMFLGRAAEALGIKLHHGVYLAVSGPCYETPAEIRAFALLGASAVGMSTIPEAIVARKYGMRVAALSCITNLAAGLGRHPLSHADVLETGAGIQKTAVDLLRRFASIYEEHR